MVLNKLSNHNSCLIQIQSKNVSFKLSVSLIKINKFSFFTVAISNDLSVLVMMHWPHKT